MRDLQALQRRSYDLIVIGGGINGAATARDAALRGLSVLLVEKGDFAGGTTSWSTRLIHGGLRYLEYFEFHLVRESLREREILLRTAPHLAKPIQMTIPIYRQGSRSYWEIQAGMILYDILSYDKSLPNHRMLSARKLRQLFRAVDADQSCGAAQYYDGQAEYAERLCLEIVLDARAAGADVLNYVTVTGLECQGDRITCLSAHDQLSKTDFTVPLSDRTVVVNTAGPWVDQVLKLGKQGSDRSPIGDRLIGGTKGSHIIVDPFPGAPSTALYVEAKSDGRPYFIVPWLGQYLIGTTDLKYSGPLEPLKADDDEVDYLLRETNRVLPTARLTREDVRFTYSGIRPLPYVDDTQKAGSITRAHILHNHGPEGVSNLVSLVGGKLTTHRQVGEEMTNWAFKHWGQTPPPSPTRHRPLPGCIWPDDPRRTEAAERYGKAVGAATLDHLFQMYGAQAIAVLALTDAAPDLAAPIVPGLPDIKAQAVYAVEVEMAHTLLDITRRRTTLAMQANYGRDALGAIAATLQTHCGWSADKVAEQIAAHHAFMAANCIPDYALAAHPAPERVGATSS
ncbi:MAG: glycerol-3-phosphate dehydrogenase/oxidase [Leptolyngbya sp.]|nr:glycerol-3-phosphate dehydrogenase/oxidase [Leptolyngbya sp.]